MPAVVLRLNGRPFVSAGTDSCCALDCTIVASRYEIEPAYITVSGMVERGPGTYDHLSWLEAAPVRDGDVLHLQVLPVVGTSSVISSRSHEQLEALRTAVGRAEPAGEFDAQRRRKRQPVRKNCALSVRTADGASAEARAADDVMTIVCSAMWAQDRDADLWKLSLKTIPASPGSYRSTEKLGNAIEILIRA